MQKIALIIPPSIFLLDERVFMPLGILKVAAVLEQAGYLVEILDLSGVKNFVDAVTDYVCVRNDIHYFGITSTTPQLPSATQIANAIRIIRKDAKIILGGPHITLVNTAYKKEIARKICGRAKIAMDQLKETFDILVAGDGEEAIFHAIKEGASKVIDADDINSPLFLTSEKLDTLPFPARHLLDWESYRYSIDGVQALSIIAQLGCPYNCGFCGGRQSPMLRRIRTRTSKKIIEEMTAMFMMTGRSGFMFYDDELNVNREMVAFMRDIIDKQTELQVNWRLRGFIKSELFNDEQAEVIYKAGFRWILVGFESGSPEILHVMNKKATVDENTRCMQIAKRHGLKVKALMSIGHPGENTETIEATKKWLLEVKPDDFDVSIITCYPGTHYYDQAIPIEKDGKSYWVYTCKTTNARLYQQQVDYTTTADYYKGDPEGGYTSYVHTDHLQPCELVEKRNSLERQIREALKIPFNPGVAATHYEHSMGQSGQFPKNILKV